MMDEEELLRMGGVGSITKSTALIWDAKANTNRTGFKVVIQDDDMNDIAEGIAASLDRAYDIAVDRAMQYLDGDQPNETPDTIRADARRDSGV
jgi:CTP:molybdopterin cytidylyltransferase MocA